MEQITTVGLDLAKNVFQVHGIDEKGKVLLRRSLRRAEVLPFIAKLNPRSRRHGGLWHSPSRRRRGG